MAVRPAVYIAMWPNQPVKVCKEHARQIKGVGKAIGLEVELLFYLGDEDCVNCIGEAKKGVRNDTGELRCCVCKEVRSDVLMREDPYASELKGDDRLVPLCEGCTEGLVRDT